MKAAKARNCQQHTLSERHDVRKLKFTPFKKEDLATFKDADRKQYLEKLSLHFFYRGHVLELFY